MISSSHLVDWLLESLELDASLFHVGPLLWRLACQHPGHGPRQLPSGGAGALLAASMANRNRCGWCGDAVFLLRDLGIACPATRTR
jgi:hypothetical protein